MSLNFCLIQKLDARKATLEKTAALTDEKKAKWREVVVFSIMTSEESGEEKLVITRDQFCIQKYCLGGLLTTPRSLTNLIIK